MKQPYLLSAFSLLLLAQAPVEAQSFQARRVGGGMQAADRVRREMSFELQFNAREHHIHEQADGSNSVVVREDPHGPKSEGVRFAPRAGLPDLGARMVQVLLPYEAAEDRMMLEVLDEQTESLGFFSVAPAGVPETGTLQEDGSVNIHRGLPEGVRLDDEGRDLAAYASDTALPSRPLLLSGFGSHRAYRYVRVTFLPFRWNPMTKELTKVLSVRAKLICQHRGRISDETRDRDLGDPGLETSDAEEECMLPSGTFESYEHPKRDPVGDYLIITTDLIRDTSTQLDPFIDMKRSQGFLVVVKTMEEILSMGPSIGRAESLRTFLRSEYQQMGVEYLLLIGDPDPDDQGLPFDTVGDVPMLMTWPEGSFIVDKMDDSSVDVHRCRIAPTDLYFTELTMGDWDLDGDGFPGEFEDDRGFVYFPGLAPVEYGYYSDSYPVDFDEELTGARIPFGDVERLDRHLAAQIRYQDEVPDTLEMTARKRVTLAMSEFHFTTQIHSLGRIIVDELAVHVDGPFTTTEIYEDSPYDILMEEGILAETWSRKWGEGLVVFAGHGSDVSTVLSTGEPFIHRDDAPDLTEMYSRSIAISIACLNARPSSTNNLTHAILEHVGVGMFAHTGCGFYVRWRSAPFGDLSYAADLGYLITQELMDGRAIGDSLRRTRGTRSTPDWQSAQNLLIMTAYGDPSSGYLFQ